MATQKYIDGQKRVYFNLTRKCFSIQRYTKGTGWRLEAHSNNVIIDYAYGKVSEKSRKRVIETKSKTVHAFLYGEITYNVADEYVNGNHLSTVRYNPYLMNEFRVFCGNSYVAPLNDFYQPTLNMRIQDGKFPVIGLA